MHIKIAKGTSESSIRKILSTIPKKKQGLKIEAFFGKLPELEDGLTLQKKIRKGWQ